MGLLISEGYLRRRTGQDVPHQKILHIAASHGPTRWGKNQGSANQQEVYANLVKLLTHSKKYFIALKLKNFNDEINSFFMDGYCSKIWNYLKLIRKVSEMEELQKFQSSIFNTMARRR